MAANGVDDDVEVSVGFWKMPCKQAEMCCYKFGDFCVCVPPKEAKVLLHKIHPTYKRGSDS